ncbi:MAG TPA: methylenetetrahydrofolate reductase [Micavibrio sp.]|nr:methylenetetrahydrofolate reductase [Micavibrio sp.]
MSKPTFSFEFFPPKTPQGEESLLETVRILSALNPAFMTVTFGAGGSTREGTLETLKAIRGVTDIPLACHLTFISITRTELKAYLDRLWAMGVRHIVALRGDMPQDLQWPLDPDLDYYQYTSDFVEGIKAHKPFEISIGAYPDKHPDAPDRAADILALKKKCAAGADRAITQFFFDHDRYAAFLKDLENADIATPVVPGMFPIGNYQNMLKFAERCGACVPPPIRQKFESAPEDRHPAIAEELLLWQIDDLIGRGIGHFHFYTLNKADMLQRILK